MTPTAAINRVLDSVDGLVIDGGNDEVVTTLLAAGTSIIGVALMRLGPREREALLHGVEHRVRDYMSKVIALQAKRTAANGSSCGHNGCHPLGFIGGA
jgi:hypothetical protein